MVTFDQLNASLLNKSIHFTLTLTDPKLLNDSASSLHLGVSSDGPSVMQTESAAVTLTDLDVLALVNF